MFGAVECGSTRTRAGWDIISYHIDVLSDNRLTQLVEESVFLLMCSAGRLMIVFNICKQLFSREAAGAVLATGLSGWHARVTPIMFLYAARKRVQACKHARVQGLQC